MMLGFGAAWSHVRVAAEARRSLRMLMGRLCENVWLVETFIFGKGCFEGARVADLLGGGFWTKTESWRLS